MTRELLLQILQKEINHSQEIADDAASRRLYGLASKFQDEALAIQRVKEKIEKMKGTPHD